MRFLRAPLLHVSSAFGAWQKLSACSLTNEPTSSQKLSSHLKMKIMMRGGPISIAEYMQDALTSPHGGYYMHRDVFGASGDFVTSPEISQMFGEMIGIWAVHTWMQMGSPERLNLVEMGPGRGTLMADLLRGTSAFRKFSSSLNVHLVEVSPTLRVIQWDALHCSSGVNSIKLGGPGAMAEVAAVTVSEEDGMGCESQRTLRDQIFKSGSTVPPYPMGYSKLAGHCKVHWHHSIETVPSDQPSLYIAHELFDALPAHQFVLDPKRGWLEKMVDTQDEVQHSSSIQADLPQYSLASAPVTAHSAVTPAFDESASGSYQYGTSCKNAPPTSLIMSSGGGSTIQNPTPCNTSLLMGSNEGSGVMIAAVKSSLSLKHHGQDTSPEGAASGIPLPLPLYEPRSSQTGTGGTLSHRQDAQDGGLTELEISARAMALAETLAKRVGVHGGAALIVDYGKDGPYGNSLVALRGHQKVDVLDGPGTSDLSVWVDFGALRLAAVESGASVVCQGPVTQRHFLTALGVRERLQQLQKRAQSSEQSEALRVGLSRLLDPGPEGMGSTYKVMAIAHTSLGDLAGF
ncbi:hypothetical protein CEUSTIGMA_g5294.t1 [Chlamydomonas eustigma]|uniref:Protein arginine methyltransferase NDUFAF7 n=1 Tax=Chlamydomonas eustigma TaxID=1157962 RepID=A0A250X4N8_9CHLO|nr:hypothetical protein CEUSTIGMA_g5294.t1 [Chlamydomonas eustigma]|eukprot:GAX77852.1 hypothetical protein CEUSTIGMA_g5294.t1 [Chlamydomonas eustigma]